MRGCLLVLVVSVGCTSAHADPPVPTVSLTPSPPPTATATPTTIAPRTFTVGAPIKFQNSTKVPTQKLLVLQNKYGAASPDGKTWITGVGQTSQLITPAQPKGITFPANSLWYARFSPDQSKVAMGQFLGPETVVSAVDAKVQWTRKQGNKACEIRFASNDELVMQEESKDVTARLVRVDLKSGKETVLGAPRRVAACSGSPDGKTFLTFNEYGTVKDAKGSTFNGGIVHRGDGATGNAIVLATDVGTDYSLSPVADRVCFIPDKKHVVKCVRSDGGQETMLQDVDEASGVTIDPSGKRMLLTALRRKNPNEQYTTIYYMVDFAAGTVRELVGIKLSTGGGVDIMDEGKLVACGTSSGIHLYDIDDAKHLFAARVPFYLAIALPGHPRKLIGGAEHPGGGALEDLWAIDVP